jgi:hypothetical protein
MNYKYHHIARAWASSTKLLLGGLLLVLFGTQFCPVSAQTTDAVAPVRSEGGIDRKGDSDADALAVTLNVVAPTMNTTPGSNISLPITVGNTTGLGVISYQFDLIYDPAVIVPQMVPVSITGTISDGMAVNYNPVSPGLLRVDAFTANNRVGAGILLYFKFTAVGSIGTSSPLTWSNFMFNEGDPMAAPANGQVTLAGPTAAGITITGRLLTSVSQPVALGRVTLTDVNGLPRTVVTNGFGYFSFTEVAAGQTFVISVVARQFTFSPRVITTDNDITDLDLIADP